MIYINIKYTVYIPNADIYVLNYNFKIWCFEKGEVFICASDLVNITLLPRIYLYVFTHDSSEGLLTPHYLPPLSEIDMFYKIAELFKLQFPGHGLNDGVARKHQLDFLNILFIAFLIKNVNIIYYLLSTIIYYYWIYYPGIYYYQMRDCGFKFKAVYS